VLGRARGIATLACIVTLQGCGPSVPVDDAGDGGTTIVPGSEATTDPSTPTTSIVTTAHR
jgi:hypothetical protein